MNILTCDDIKKMQNDGWILVDVREPVEYQNFKLPKSINKPLSAFSEFITSINKDSKILLYCRTGQRSQMAEQYLQQLGYNAKNIGGVVHYQSCLVP